MQAKKRARVALATAMVSTLILPGYVLAESKPAQPGTVRPAEKAEAQPGTSKAEKAEILAQKEQKAAPAPAPKQEQKAAPAPVSPAVSDQAVVAAPKEPVVVAPAPEPVRQPATQQATYTPAAKNSEPSTTSMAQQATETTLSDSVRESAVNEGAYVPETDSVRTQHNDEVARYELAADVREGGDVRDKAGKDKEVVTRLGDDDGLTPVDAPDDDPQGDDDTDNGSDPAAVAAPAPQPVSEVTAGAAVTTPETTTTSVEVGASQTGSEVSVSRQIEGAEAAEVSASYDYAAHTVSVSAPQTQFEVEVPQVPAEVSAAVEQALPAEVKAAVDQSVGQAQQAVDAQLAALSTGEHVTDTAIGQVSTWLNTK
ncbi:hypothetical protein [Corynebacterium senegalense]|uniref:hypothetical protein n=1 Tax=Corynebacterium senegalense TaxID=2080750 RepID=UPI0011C04C5F|nr:hypothetical protein [Corynebacterium senegalense]